MSKPAILIGTSQQSENMRKFAERAGKTDHTILLLGEPGSGKDHLAEVIHSNGKQDKPFVPVDCGSLAETLSETELFGHTSGAFTDARMAKQGLVQVAENGTIFFNEIANMSLILQAKFLRIMEKRSFRAVGGTKEMKVNTRIIVATNVDLEEAVSQGKFRFDLYQRLNVIAFVVPPLREHVEDVPALAEYFLSREAGLLRKFTPEALYFLRMGLYGWPGNIRELQNVVARSAFLAGENQCVQLAHVQSSIKSDLVINDTASSKFLTLDQLEDCYFREVLRNTRGDISAAAKIAGITRQALSNRIKGQPELKAYVESMRGL